MDADERRWDKKVKFIRVYLRLSAAKKMAGRFHPS
jgi:hypothetical protein